MYETRSTTPSTQHQAHQHYNDLTDYEDEFELNLIPLRSPPLHTHKFSQRSAPSTPFIPLNSQQNSHFYNTQTNFNNNPSFFTSNSNTKVRHNSTLNPKSNTYYINKKNNNNNNIQNNKFISHQNLHPTPNPQSYMDLYPNNTQHNFNHTNHHSSKTTTRKPTTKYTSSSTSLNAHNTKKAQQLQQRVNFCLDWMTIKQTEMAKETYGRDTNTTLQALNKQMSTQQAIKQFQQHIQQCALLKKQLSADEELSFKQQLSQLQLLFNQLHSDSNFRLANLKTLLKFLDSTAKESEWMKKKEGGLSDYITTLTNLQNDVLEMERFQDDFQTHHTNINHLTNQATKLSNDAHPANNVIQLSVNVMNMQWKRLQILAHCLKLQVINMQSFVAFMKELKLIEEWAERQEGLIDISKTPKQLQHVQQEFEDSMRETEARMNELLRKYDKISPLKLNNHPFPPNTAIKSICSYQLPNSSIREGEECVLLSDFLGGKWRVKVEGGVAIYPSCCFSVLSPLPSSLSFSTSPTSSSSSSSQTRSVQDMIKNITGRLESLKTRGRNIGNERREKEESRNEEMKMERMKDGLRESRRRMDEFKSHKMPSDIHENKSFHHLLMEGGRSLLKLQSALSEVQDTHTRNECMNEFDNIKLTHSQLLQRQEVLDKMFANEEVLNQLSSSPSSTQNIQRQGALLKTRESLLQNLMLLLECLNGKNNFNDIKYFQQATQQLHLFKLNAQLLSTPLTQEAEEVVEEVIHNNPVFSIKSALNLEKNAINVMPYEPVERQDVGVYEGGGVLLEPLEEHMQCEDAEDMVQPLENGEERISKHSKQEFHSRRTNNAFESISTHVKNLSSLTSTKTSAFSGNIDFPLSFQTAEKLGLLNYQEGFFVHPQTSVKCSLKQAVVTNLLGSDGCVFICPTNNKHHHLFNAFNIKLLSEEGFFDSLDGSTSFQELIDTKYVILKTKKETKVEEKEEEEEEEYNEDDAGKVVTSSNVYAVLSVIEPQSLCSIDAFTAVQRGVLDQANGTYNALDSFGQIVKIAIKEAVEMGLVQVDENYVGGEDEDGKLIHETKTFSVNAVIDPISKKEISLSDAIKQGYLHQNNATFHNHISNKTIPIIEAISLGHVIANVISSDQNVDPYTCSKITVEKEVAFVIKSVLDVESGIEMNVNEAIKCGIFNTSRGELKNKKTGKVMSLNEAVDMNFIKIQEGRPHVEEVGREEKVNSLHIDDEMDAREEMAREEIVEERRTFQITGVKDAQNNKFVSFMQAIQMGLVDEANGLYVNNLTGKKVTIPEALEKGFLVGSTQTVDHQELFKSDVVARKKDEIHSVYNPISKAEISVNEALNLGLITKDFKRYYSPATNQFLTFEQAVKHSFITLKVNARNKNKSLEKDDEVSNKTRISIDWTGARVINKDNKQVIAIKEALKHGLIDESVAAVLRMKNPDVEEVEVFEENEIESDHMTMIIKMKFIRDSSGRIIIKDQTVNHQKSHERVHSHLKSSSGMSLYEALKLGLYSVQRGFYYDPHTKNKFSLFDAISVGLLNTKLPALVDVTDGKSISLKDMIAGELVDSKTGKILTSKLPSLKLTLDPIYVGHHTPYMNLEDAIRCRLYDDEMGLFNIPFTDKTVDLSTAINMGYIYGRGNIVLNPISGERLYLQDALKKAVIDANTGRFVDSSLEKNITLSRAILIGLIKHVYLNQSSIIMQCTSDQLFSIEDAIDHKLIDFDFPSVYDALLKKRVPLKIALNSGLIDIHNKKYINRLDGTETSLSLASNVGLLNLPGVPILTQPKVSSNDVVQTQLHTNVSLKKGAKLQEKITETIGGTLLPPLELSKTTARKLKNLSNNPIEENSIKNEENKKTLESKFYDTKTDDTPLETTVTDDGTYISSKKTVTKVHKSKTKESAENIEDPYVNAITTATNNVSAISYECPEKRDEEVSRSDDYARRFIPPLEPLEVEQLTSKVESRFKPVLRVEENVETFQRVAPTFKQFAFYPVKEDVSKGVEGGLIKINWQSGNVIDLSENILMNSNEAYAKGFIDLHIKDLIDNRTCNPNLNSIKRLTLNEALTNQLLIIPLSQIRDPITNETMTLEKAIEGDIIDIKRSVMIDPATHKAKSVMDLVHSCHFNISNAVLRNKQNGKILTLAQIIFQGFLPEEGLPKVTQPYTESEAVKDGLLDKFTGEFIEPISKVMLSEQVAREIGYIIDDDDDEEEEKSSISSFQAITLINALRNRIVCPESLIFTHPCIGDQLSLNEAISNNYIIVPKINEELQDVGGMMLQKALQQGFVDIDRSIFTDAITGAQIPFDTAIKNGWLLLPTDETSQLTRYLEFPHLPLKFADAVICGLYDENISLFTNPHTGKNTSLEDAIHNNLIDPSSLVNHPFTNQPTTLQHAIQEGLVDGVSGKLFDASVDKSLNMNEALYRGLIKSTGPCLWIGIPFLDYLKTSGKVSVYDHLPENYQPLQRAINEGLIDLNNDFYLNKKTNETFTLKQAAQRRYILIEKFKQDDMIDFKIIQALDTARNNWIRPKNALRSGILNMKEKLYFDTKDNQYLSLLEALKYGKIIVDSLEAETETTYLIKKVYDSESNSWVSPFKAEKEGVLDMKDEVFINLMNNQKMSLFEAVESGFIEADEVEDIEVLKRETVKASDIREVLDYTTGEKLTLDEAIEKKLVDRSGCFYIDPRDGSSLTLYEAWQKGYIKLKSDDLFAFKSKMITSVLDARTGEEIPISDAVRHQIVDKVTGKYWNMKTNTYMDLDFAISNGLVLVEAADKALNKCSRVEVDDPFESQAKVFVISSVRIPGCEEELDPVEAERRGYINKVQGVYMYPLTGEKISIKDAIKRNFVVASVVEDPDYDELQQNEAAYAILESDKLFSEISSIVDLRNGEKVSVFEGIRRGLIDLKNKLYLNEKTGEKIPIYKAIQQNLVLASVSCDETAGRKLYYFKVSSGGKTSQSESSERNEERMKEGVMSNRWTLKEAISRGFVDQKNNLFYDPVSHETFSLDEAIQRGFLFIDNFTNVHQDTANVPIESPHQPTNFNSHSNNHQFSQLSQSRHKESNELNNEVNRVKSPRTESLDRLLMEMELETAGKLMAEESVNVDSVIYSQPIKPKLVSPSDFNTINYSSSQQPLKYDNTQV